MGKLGFAVRHNLAGLLRFSGRESSAVFWPYAIAAFVLSVAIDMAMMMTVIANMITRIQHYLIVHPEGLPKPRPGEPPTLPPELMPDMTGLALPMAAVNAGLMLLLAAAVVRRLHDRDRTGLWALLPIPFSIIGMINSKAAFGYAMGQHQLGRTQSLLFAIGPLSWVTLIILIVMLAGDGTKGPNRFGPPPTAPS